MLIWWWHAKHHIVSLWSSEESFQLCCFFQIPKKHITNLQVTLPLALTSKRPKKKITWHDHSAPSLGVSVPASSMTKERQTLSAAGFKAKAKLEPHGELNIESPADVSTSWVNQNRTAWNPPQLCSNSWLHAWPNFSNALSHTELHNVCGSYRNLSQLAPWDQSLNLSLDLFSY